MLIRINITHNVKLMRPIKAEVTTLALKKTLYHTIINTHVIYIFFKKNGYDVRFPFKLKVAF